MPKLLYKCDICFRTYDTEKEAKACSNKAPRKCTHVVDLGGSDNRYWNKGEVYLLAAYFGGGDFRKVRIVDTITKEHDLLPVLRDVKTGRNLERDNGGILVYIPEWN